MSSRISGLKYELPITGINKTCNKCFKNKDTSLFYNSKIKKDGKLGHCIECDIKYKKLYYLKNKDKIIKKTKDVYQLNIEESRIKSRNAVKSFRNRNPFYYSKLNE